MVVQNSAVMWSQQFRASRIEDLQHEPREQAVGEDTLYTESVEMGSVRSRRDSRLGTLATPGGR